jgi:hypothetical protein
MTSINGVHALLAFLAQQTQLTKLTNATQIDAKQIDALLQESRLLNERLLKIENLLGATRIPNIDSEDSFTNSTSKPEGDWPAASVVRDVINRQERQQAYGHWSRDGTSASESDPYTYRENETRENTASSELRQLLVERYIPNEVEQGLSQSGIYYGAYREDMRGLQVVGDEVAGDGGRLLLIAIGFSLLLFALFSVLN